ncbi:MAG TPA: SIR2 family protein [Thermoanaerobaculia bacterium]|nr:SIR2 family protein [Thermoanaerobaculia bacterium]
MRPRDPIESIFNFRPKLVKLHGSISDPSSIVLNVTSYAKTYDKELEWFLAHIFQNTTVLFVGAGLAESEPYMRFIRLLNSSKLLRGHHYAIMPFAQGLTGDATDKVIRDRSNILETIGIRTLPYVVSEPKDHHFVVDLLRELQANSKDALSKTILALENALQLYGPENVGPTLFRLFATLDRAQLDQKPFLILVVKFLRLIRRQERKDLGRLWRSQLSKLIDYHEAQTKKHFAEELKGGQARSSKAREIAENKMFMYDSGF